MYVPLSITHYTVPPHTQNTILYKQSFFTLITKFAWLRPFFLPFSGERAKPLLDGQNSRTTFY